ncbi:MAG: hypothetical protein DYG96_06860, partial [Chlorobi bacterium CHB2]|nr:hypothetical protein [Chlorobi bacterium CHB2]
MLIPIRHNGTLPLRIAAMPFAIGAHFIRYDGAIDDIKLYNGVLSETQIAALYSEGGWPIPTS